MPKTIRFLCVFLCAILLLISVFVPCTSATATQGKITGDGVRLRSETKTGKENDGNIITSLSKGTIVNINGTVKDETDGTWYNVTYNNYTGFVFGQYVEEITPAPFNADFEENLKNFPESYRQALRNIHNVYPNWVFKADSVNMSLDDAINLEYNATDLTKTRKCVELSSNSDNPAYYYGIEWRDPRADSNNPAHIVDGRWIYASRQAIAFFMDPRNGLTLNPEKSSFPSIFTFMEQSYDPSIQTVEGLRKVIGTSFLSKGYDVNGNGTIETTETDAYINDIMQAAQESEVSPYVIAGIIITEQGANGNTGSVSGTYTGYVGYYNFFNVNASGKTNSEIITSGLEYAKKQEWNSRRASIIGGAKFYESGYLGVDQDTYYYMDFNVKYPNRIWHQYATALYDQCTKAANAKKAYISNTTGALTFKIPVYKGGMPESAYEKPSIENYNPEPQNPSTPTTPTPSTPARRKGDFDGDGQVTVKELATIRMYLLGVKSLSVEERAYMDVSGDNDVTVKDLALVRMYLLGLVTI